MLDVAMVGGRLTQVKGNRVTLDGNESISTYETELPEFESEEWIVEHLGEWVECKVVGRQIIEVDAGD